MNRVLPALALLAAATPMPASYNVYRGNDDIGPHPKQEAPLRFDRTGTGWMDPTQLARLGRKNRRPKKTRR